MKHEFALFVPQLSALLAEAELGQEVAFEDVTLAHRIHTVLRMRSGDLVTFFDRTLHAQAKLEYVRDKKKVVIKFITKAKNKHLTPKIDVFLPVLKRDDFHDALYAMVELGASSVQLVTTQKAQYSWSGAKDIERAQRVMISAAEQSKNYSLPTLFEPVSLEQAINNSGDARKIFFDPKGKPLLEVLQEAKKSQENRFILLVGPEGDLSDSEKSLLQSNNVVFCALTPTILRSIHAISLGLGVFRSVL